MTVTFDPSPAPDGRTICQRRADEAAQRRLLREWDAVIALVTDAPEPAYGPLRAIKGESDDITAPGAAHPATRALEKAGRDRG